MAFERLRNWWTLDKEAEAASDDNPFEPVRPEQRQEALPMLALAFGWGFLITGLITGGQIGTGLVFWPDFIAATFAGNFINFVIGALVAVIAFKTACNSGLLYQFVYGRVGVLIPVLFVALLLTGWQAIIVGSFGFTFAQSFDTAAFYVVAILGGLLFTATAYLGVKGIEKVSLPSVLVLVAVGLYAAWLNLDEAGGMNAFIAISAESARENPISFPMAVNLAVGSWIVGAVVMAEYARFAKRTWVAIAIPFIVMIVSQWFLQVIGAMGSVVSGSADFTTYLLEQGMFVAGLGILGMSLALWTTGNANLYLPAIQTSAVMKRPKGVMVVIWGLLGTVLGLGLYQHFLDWINLLAALVPPLVGPLIVDYYVVHKGRYDAADLERLPRWNVPALASYAIGAFFAIAHTRGLLTLPDALIPSLFGLLASMAAYWLLWLAGGRRAGYSQIKTG